MANKGRPHTNGSQFIILFDEMPMLDGRYVVFGEVAKGFNILDMIEESGTTVGRPAKTVVISDCGVYPKTAQYLIPSET